MITTMVLMIMAKKKEKGVFRTHQTGRHSCYAEISGSGTEGITTRLNGGGGGGGSSFKQL